MVLRLASVTRGTITVDGTDIATLRGRHLRSYYRLAQGVFQDPFSSYNPIFKADRVLDLVHDGFYPHIGGPEWRRKVTDALEAVRLEPADVLNKYPHQLSGGQLQRMLIARALLLDVKLLVADEIISMLDASTRIDVLNLLAELKSRGLAILFITHDLSLGNYVSERAIILRKGAIVESGSTAQVFVSPSHPYTKQLLASVPRLQQRWSASPGGCAPDGEPAAQVGLNG
jgi:peptide/nickel transport system ATP-binding protein